MIVTDLAQTLLGPRRLMSDVPPMTTFEFVLFAVIMSLASVVFLVVTRTDKKTGEN